MTSDVVVANGFVGECRTVSCHAVTVVKVKDTFPETPKYVRLKSPSASLLEADSECLGQVK